MNIQSILKNIPNKEGAGYFQVILPSLGKELRIRHLSVNDQKIISKLAIHDSGSVFASEADLAKISIAETNSLVDVDLEEIDVRDYFILCCALRKENYMDSFSVDYECPKCAEQFNEVIDFDRLVEAATEYSVQNSVNVVHTAAGDAQISVGIPRQIDLIMLEMYYARIAATRDVTPAEKYIDYVICCINSCEFKNEAGEWEAVDGFSEMAFMDKSNFFQSVSANIEEIAKLFESIGMITSNFFYDIQCPACKHKISSFMDTADFFML